MKDEEYITEIYKKIYRISFLSWSWILFVICLGMMAFSPYLLTDSQSLTVASVGILTFIAIFYSLLVTKEYNEVYSNINEIFKKVENKIKEDVKEMDT